MVLLRFPVPLANIFIGGEKMGLEYWMENPNVVSALNERDQRFILAELQAEKLRNVERVRYGDMQCLDNAEKMEILKRWYPRAYSTIRYYFPAFTERPNDFPFATARAVNELISTYVQRDATLRFS